MTDLSRWYKQTSIASIVSIVGLPGTALACDNWNFGNSLTLVQANGPHVVVRDIEGTRKRLSYAA